MARRVQKAADMRSPATFLLLFTSVAACSHTVTGSGEPLQVDPTNTPSSSSPPEHEEEAEEAPASKNKSADASAPVRDASAPVRDVKGKYCGKAVASPAECLGNDAEYLTLVTGVEIVTGQLCESYPNKDCLVLQNGRLEGTALTFEVDARDKIVWGSFHVLDDGHLVGELSNSDGYRAPFTFFKLP